jgi:hypothetical protein
LRLVFAIAAGHGAPSELICSGPNTLRDKGWMLTRPLAGNWDGVTDGRKSCRSLGTT